MSGRPRSHLLLTTAALGLVCLSTPAWAAKGGSAKGGNVPKGGPAGVDEVQYPPEEFKQLDTFEAESLARADKQFALKDYRRAVREYESFILEFGKSRAVPYALLRKGRASQLDNKRLEAIKIYRDLLDCFPNQVAYAAPALYQTAVCHSDDGDLQKALKAWSDMAADAGYARHPLGAAALNRLSEELQKQGKMEEAVGYYQQVAVDFRETNPAAAHEAMGRAIAWLMVNQAEPKLRAFYERARTFGRQPQAAGNPPAQDRPYWETVLGLTWQHSRFEKEDVRVAYCRYWSGFLDGKFPDSDEYQLSVANLVRIGEKDDAKYQERLDKQFERGFKPGDYARIIRWMELLAEFKPKVQQYYQKLDFSHLNNAQIEEIMRFFYDKLKDNDLGRSTFGRLHRNEFDDNEKARLAKYFYTHDEGLVRDLCSSMQDKDWGKFVMLGYYVQAKKVEQALTLADELILTPQWAKEALKIKAELLEQLKQYDKAIAAWRMLDEPPAAQFRIVGCYTHMGKIDEAVRELTEIENFFKAHSSSAAYQIAGLYRGADRQRKYIAQLRYIMNKYPKSQESVSAHLELEKAGAKIGGGVDDDK